VSKSLNIKPGDLIEWVYKRNNELVIDDEMLWSTIEECYVPIGRELVHMCISVEGDVYSWLNEKGLFLARADDAPDARNQGVDVEVVPRARE